jgi:hypothetical protein
LRPIGSRISGGRRTPFVVDLKNRVGDVETDCRDRLYVWLLRIVGP